jgi:hypothetical protein
MRLHEFKPHNSTIFFIGALLLFTGTYLDNTKKASDFIIWTLLILSFVFMLLSFIKPKRSQKDEL